MTFSEMTRKMRRFCSRISKSSPCWLICGDYDNLLTWFMGQYPDYSEFFCRFEYG